MKQNMMDILDRLARHSAAIGFMADRIEDSQASAALATIGDDMTKTAEILGNLNEKKTKKG